MQHCLAGARIQFEQPCHASIDLNRHRVTDNWLRQPAAAQSPECGHAWKSELEDAGICSRPMAPLLKQPGSFVNGRDSGGGSRVGPSGEKGYSAIRCTYIALTAC